MMKLQTQAITLVLISGIVLTLTGTAYFWGAPLLEKRTIVGKFESSINFMQELVDTINDMANTCSTTKPCEKTISLPFQGLISVDEEDNSINFEYSISQNIVGSDEWVPINTASAGEVVSIGEEPCVIFIKTVSEKNLNKIKLKLHCRTLVDENNIYHKILFTGSGTGNNGIRIKYSGIEETGNKRDTIIEVSVI